MKKSIKKSLCKLMLTIFSSNIFITSAIKPVALPLIPIAIPVAKVAIQALMVTSGVVIAGLGAKVLSKRHNYPIDNFVHDADNNAQATVPTIAKGVVQAIEIAATEGNTDEAVKVATSCVSHAEAGKLKRIATESIITKQIDIPTTRGPITVSYIPYGIHFETNNHRFNGTVQATNRSAQNQQRMEMIYERSWFNKMKHRLLHNKAYHEQIACDLRSIVRCMTDIQSGDLNKSIPASLTLDTLAAQLRDDTASYFLSWRIQRAVDKLKKVYFHKDDTICYTALKQSNPKACKVITDLADSLERDVAGKNWLGKIKVRTLKKEELIQPKTYNTFKAIAATKNSSTCNHKKLAHGQADVVMHDLVDCFNESITRKKQNTYHISAGN